MLLEFILNYVIPIFLGYILADLIMGIYHWLKDTYFGPFTPIIGKKFIWGSRLHHVRPRYVLEFSDKHLFIDSALWTLIWMGPLFMLRGTTCFMLSLFFIISFNDVVHKYAHMYDHERPVWASVLQRMGIFQSHDEHHLHHIEPHNINYCPITPYVNFFLEKINFWRKLESIIEVYLGIKARKREYDFMEDPGYPAGIKFLP